jgi:polyketide cyclase/dehydrase/lipid transport protein
VFGWGRSFHRLGPLSVPIGAPRELVFEVIRAPYLGRQSRASREEIEVLERGSDMVLAAHRTRVRGISVVTVETVRFTSPERVDFRLVRGPVAHVVERFELHDTGKAGTELSYHGELGSDLWWLGRWWGRRVARTWTAVVASSFEKIRAAAEERAAARSRRS